MRGNFEKILGKTISDVYCRVNEGSPPYQIFLIFDDDTYFEIYAYGNLKGAGGIDIGGLDKVLSLNHLKGEGVIFGSSMKMWVPALISYPEKRLALSVPANSRVESDGDYWDLLTNYLQKLVEEIPENEAKNLIELNLRNGKDLTSYVHSQWGCLLAEQDEMKSLVDEVMSEICNGIFLTMDEQKSLQSEIENNSLEKVLNILSYKFELSDDVNYLISIVEDFVVHAIRNIVHDSKDIISLGKFLYVLRQLPFPVEGATYIDVSISNHFNGETKYISFQVSETQFSVSIGGSDGYSEMEWLVDIDGCCQNYGDIYRLKDTISECLNLDFSVTIEDESDFLIE